MGVESEGEGNSEHRREPVPRVVVSGEEARLQTQN